jgi:hypothetical protein
VILMISAFAMATVVMTTMWFTTQSEPGKEETRLKRSDVGSNYVDPCDKPQFCENGLRIPYPGDCHFYNWCANGLWIKASCSNGTLFDNATLQCTLPDLANCQPECFDDGLSSTVSSVTSGVGGACGEVTSCVDNYRYPDSLSCYHYWVCSSDRLLPQTCAPGTVFDIYELACIFPYENFDCAYRCMTLPPPIVV